MMMMVMMMMMSLQTACCASAGSAFPWLSAFRPSSWSYPQVRCSCCLHRWIVHDMNCELWIVVTDCELIVTMNCELIVTVDFELIVTMDCELIVVTDCELIVTMNCELIVTVDFELIVTMDCELIVVTDCELPSSLAGLFVLGKRWYTINPPTGSVITDFFKCIGVNFWPSLLTS